MKLSIKQKQEIYEHLLTLDCPDLLAALIADRCDTVIKADGGDVHSWVSFGFNWDSVAEGVEFWCHMYDCVWDFECPEEYEGDFSNHGGGSALEDYSLPVTPVAVAIESDALNSPYQRAQEPLSLWTRVKLFLGKLSYGV